MSPIPRCNLRLPSISKHESVDSINKATPKQKIKSPVPKGNKTNVSAKVKSVQGEREVVVSWDDSTGTELEPQSELKSRAEEAATTDDQRDGPEPAHECSDDDDDECVTRDTAESLQRRKDFKQSENQKVGPEPAHECSDESEECVTRDTAESLQRRKEFKQSENQGVGPEPAHECSDDDDECVTRDTAESLQRRGEFQQSLTRDTYEVYEQQQALEGATCTATTCRDQADKEVCDQPPSNFNCPGTPGDDSGFPVPERPESPYLETDLSIYPVDANGKRMARRSTDGTVLPPPVICKHHYKPKKYIGMWGSEDSYRRWTKHKLESRMKRKLLERKHAKNSWLREQMRMHARNLRRRLRCKDQSKIPVIAKEVFVNKAYYFRFNYNRDVPCMPADMNRHMNEFKRPPFRRFQKGKKVCFKYIDEFDKLRVCEEDAKTLK